MSYEKGPRKISGNLFAKTGCFWNVLKRYSSTLQDMLIMKEGALTGK